MPTIRVAIAAGIRCACHGTDQSLVKRLLAFSLAGASSKLM
jgi:hypothetical protein